MIFLTGTQTVEAWEQDKTRPVLSALASTLHLSTVMSLTDDAQGFEDFVELFNKAEVRDSGNNEVDSPEADVVAEISPSSTNNDLELAFRNALSGIATSSFPIKYFYRDDAGNTRGLEVQGNAIVDDVPPTFEVCLDTHPATQINSNVPVTLEAGTEFPGFEFKNLVDQDQTKLDDNLYLDVSAKGEMPQWVVYDDSQLENIKDSFYGGGYGDVPSNFNSECLAAGEYCFNFQLRDGAGNFSCITAVLRVIDTQAPYVEWGANSPYADSMIYGATVEGESRQVCFFAG